MAIAPAASLAVELLDGYRHAGTGAGRGGDAGPAVLAMLAAENPAPGAMAAARDAVPVWLQGFRDGARHGGLHDGGLSGFLAGARFAAAVDDRIATLVDRLRETCLAWVEQRPWRTARVGMIDYDLLFGAAGTLVSFNLDRGCPVDRWAPVARHLTALCAVDGLPDLRLAYMNGPNPSRGVGRINTGLAHGVPGIVVALGTAPVAAPDRALMTGALRRAAQWLRDESFVDSRGVVTWTAFGRDGRPPPDEPLRRQAWCYGTPGVAWSLWEAGRVLDDPGLRSFAAGAMASYCAAFDESLYLYGADPDDWLGVCHGAAGTLAVADAFARHAGLDPAAELRPRLERYLIGRLDEVRALAGQNMSLLSGASGVAAVLLTVDGGSRDWLPLIGLR